ncbi:aminopeptidase [Paenibacillus chartarius]|uniref:Aminopeptidase n=1 Tax=Paenibacillus chartarius TaxID=747481 RepID=A0ABV6DGA5_9BACL
MHDSRLTKLAELIASYSIDVQPGDNVWIDNSVSDPSLAIELMRAISARGGKPYVKNVNQRILRQFLITATEDQIRTLADNDLAFMKQMQGYVSLAGSDNISELSDVPADRMQLYRKLHTKPVHFDQRLEHTKWTLLRYPNASMAQLANMSTEGFEQFYFDVCTMDYARMNRAMDPLKALMDRTDMVRITGPGTDLSFSIRGIGSVKCAGDRNLPDGEVFTAPVRDSVNGFITYNTPSPYGGYVYDNVRLEFADGRITNATAAANVDGLNQIFDTDEGARYVGEFAIGVNPYIMNPLKDILFDEKIAGSFHFTPGSCIPSTPNGNSSSVHWDLVNIQRPEYGGGEIWFDGVLIRKDGLFVVPELEQLNPEHLK